MTRRQILVSSAALAAGQGGLRAQQPTAGPQPSAAPEVLPMEQWEPKSVLKLPETHVPRARYPVIDFHTHMTHGSRQALGTEITVSISPDEALPVMERKNIRTLVNLTGSYGAALKQAVAKIQEPHPGKFVVFTEPAYDKASDPGYPKTQADLIEQAHRDGAKGLKVLKTLGLFLQEKGKQNVRQTRRPALRSDVGSHRSIELARRLALLRAGRVLFAVRPLQRTMGGDAHPPGVELVRKRDAVG